MFPRIVAGRFKEAAMPEVDLEALGAAAGPMQVWILPALLGLGLASATGLRTFLPLLMLALAARFEVFGVQLIEQMDWLVSWPARSPPPSPGPRPRTRCRRRLRSTPPRRV